MPSKLMVGLWRFILKLPPAMWEKQIRKSGQRFTSELAFMTGPHRRVHHHVVRALPGAGGPLSPGAIAADTNLPLETVTTILDDLEKHMTFLFRNDRGEVVWAYPVTVAETPHRLTFNTGERLFAA